MELDQPNGKNDGSMNGVRYFKCLPNHGIFVLQSKVKRSTDPFLLHVRNIGHSATSTPVSSGPESIDYVAGSGSGSISLATSGASGLSEAEAMSPSPHTSPATARRRMGARSNK